MPGSDLTYRWSVEDLLSATGGQLVCGERSHQFTDPAIDSRRLKPGQFFVAICGQHHDGHKFAQQVLDFGGQGLIVQEDRLTQLPLDDWQRGDIVCLAVPDTTRALGQLARFHRQRMPAAVVAITGSNGKTTTKEFTKAVLSQDYAVWATQGNLNNEIGLPLTLFELQPHHRWAVVELGMNHAGEIARLGAICQPDVGVITNIAPVHLEGLGTIDNVREAKAELLPQIQTQGHVVLNRDDHHLCRLKGRFPQEVWVGLSEDAAVNATDIRLRDGQTLFDLHMPEQQPLAVQLQFVNPVMVHNALAAAAVGWLAGISAERIGRGLAQFASQPGRMHVSQLLPGINVIDDTYNANPASMQAALDAFMGVNCRGRRFVVLGDMFELGQEGPQFHHDLGFYAGGLALHKIYLAGEFASIMAQGARQGGLTADQVFVGDHSDIAQAIKDEIQVDDWMLVKGSRGMAMELVIKELDALLGQRQG